jgi:protein Mpv17
MASWNFTGNAREAASMQAVKKTCFGQVTIFPTYVAAFFGYVSLLEGCALPQARQRVKEKFWPTVATGTLFWPAANMVNFTVVPQQHRVLYVALLGLIWNSYLSWVNSRAVQMKRL